MIASPMSVGAWTLVVVALVIAEGHLSGGGFHSGFLLLGLGIWAGVCLALLRLHDIVDRLDDLERDRARSRREAGGDHADD